MIFWPKEGNQKETTSSVGLQLAVSHASMGGWDMPPDTSPSASIKASLWFLNVTIFDKSTEIKRMVLGCVCGLFKIMIIIMIKIKVEEWDEIMKEKKE